MRVRMAGSEVPVTVRLAKPLLVVVLAAGAGALLFAPGVQAAGGDLLQHMLDSYFVVFFNSLSMRFGCFL